MVCLVRPLAELRLSDIGEVGGKNASLGEMLGQCAAAGVRVPDGFATTTAAYRRFIAHNGLAPLIAAKLAAIAASGGERLDTESAGIRAAIAAGALPDDLVAAITASYRALEARHGTSVAVAVRSSATAEDLPGASFAGQHDSFLGVRGLLALLDAVRRCFASLYTARAISYRADQAIDETGMALSVGVQKMVRADRAASGVIFTLDTESGFRDVVMITGVWGLGEAIVQGVAEPDEFIVHKPTFNAGHRAVLRRRIGRKEARMVYAPRGSGAPTALRPTTRDMRRRACLGDAEILQLAGQAIAIETHYSALAGRPTPMDIEWAKDGPDGELCIIQARPETVHVRGDAARLQQYRLTGRGDVLVSGRAVGASIAAGRVRHAASTRDLASVETGDVLVSRTTSPDWEPALKRVSAIITETGGRTCHAAIVARELGVPAIVGAAAALKTLHAGDTVTVSCAEGETGRVYAGRVAFAVDEVDVSALQPPPFKLMVNLGNPELAFQTSALPVDGVGLARIEFIIAETIRAHPMALLHPDRVTSARARRDIARLTRGHASGADYFVEKLAEGAGMIAAAFYPRPVIVRTSDFKTNEYAALLGGADFEPVEANPMIGFRGASRYADPAYREAFALECRALKRVRDDVGLANLIVMIPFCRRLDEAHAVLAEMEAAGLRRGENGLEVFVMTEIPSNVILADDFAQLFDGFSIGSNDLTQLVLGVDRDSERVAFDFDEHDPAVTRMIAMAIDGAHRNARVCGICGQLPSDDPAFARWLAERGIDSVSVTPDSVLSVLHEFNRAAAVP
jgi:pyruvate,water dikinase